MVAALAQQIEDDDAGGHGPIMAEGSTSLISQASNQIPVIRLDGNSTIYRRVLKVGSSATYRDEGAQCSDATDGCEGLHCGQFRSSSGFPLVMVAGEVVNLKRVGVYKMQYTCMNSVGAWAAPVERRIVVTGATHQACLDVQVEGLPPSAIQAQRMGRYRFESQDHGRPLYKQVNGSNYLYFRSNFPDPCWVVDGYLQNDVRGLRLDVKAESLSPFAAEGAAPNLWTRLKSNKLSGLRDEDPPAFVADARISVSCVRAQNKLVWYPHIKHKTKIYDETPTEEKKNKAEHLRTRNSIYGNAQKLMEKLEQTTHGAVACKEHITYGKWSKGCSLSCGPGAQRFRQRAVVKCSGRKGNKPTTAFFKEHKRCKVRKCHSGEKSKAVHVVVPEVGTYY
jgi:hypothetical protein